MTNTIRVQVFSWPGSGGVLTVVTDRQDGGGTRIAGPKMLPGECDLVGEFELNRATLDVLIEELES